MKILIALAALASSVSDVSAQGAGGPFQSFPSWSAVQAEAKAEKKPIFIDCFATWCGPCKAMDKTTYPDSAVEAALHDHFICIKVQMDQTPKDSDEVKGWYADAASLARAYGVKEYPTFLFISPDGKPLHECVGYMAPTDFIATLQAALDPSKQYYTLLSAYQSGQLGYAQFPALVKSEREANDGDQAESAIRYDLDHYLNHLDESQLMDPDTLWLVADDVRSTDKIFGLFLRKGTKVDQTCNHPGLAALVAKRVITQEEIDPQLWVGTGKNRKAAIERPDWIGLAAAISSKYGAENAAPALFDAKIDFYTTQKDWVSVAHLYLDKWDHYGTETRGFGGTLTVNNAVWNIFLHCTDKSILTRASTWQCKVITDNPGMYNMIDTYANVLYKMGNRDEAIAWETEAVRLISPALDDARAKGRKIPEHLQELPDNLDKMKRGIPTWTPI